MKRVISAVAFSIVLLFGASELRAQVYGAPYWDVHYQQYLHYQHYLQWQQYLEYLRHNDPYYALHSMHYQLYLQPYQPYQTYLPCCYSFGVPLSPTLILRSPSIPRVRSGQPSRRK